MEWEKITNVILISSFAVLAIFVVLGIIQWISRGSLKKVDKQLLYMPIPLVLMLIVYLVCDKLLPNLFPGLMPTRPDGSGEPSFPSTHVMVVATIFFVVITALPKYIKSKPLRIIFEIALLILTSLVATGRIMANKHTIVDVVGAVIFAFIFTEIYHQCIKKHKVKKEPNHE